MPIRGLAYRITVICVNIIFPPAAVLIVAGGGWDTILNCLLFLLAIIPSHIHGFYITCTYFHRRNKVSAVQPEADTTSDTTSDANSAPQVKKGKYPGDPKPLIHSKNVLNGGASDREVNRLYYAQYGSGKKYRV